MIKKLILIGLTLLSITLTVQAQSGKFYTTSGGEIIFSSAQLENNGSEEGSIIRFSPVFNFQNMINYDVGKSFGLFSGLTFRNVGFIYEAPNTNIKKKYRTYNLGIPIGVKIGKMNGFFLYGGYELEIPFNYKEKTFEGGDKMEKFNVWFSDRTTSIQEAVMVGVQFPQGGNIKFKYYLTNFFNKDFSETINGVTSRPFQNFDVNVFYISLNFDLFRNTTFYYKDMKDRQYD